MSLELHDRFSKNSEILNLMKIRTVGDELLDMDRSSDRWAEVLTDLTKQIVTYGNSVNVHTNSEFDV